MGTDELGTAAEIAGRFLDNIETVVHGKRDRITLVAAALMCGGHALLEDVPGTAKTVLARAIAHSIEGAAASRIQCTPDLQPTDVTGLSIFNQRERDFEFRAGPVFANVVLVDEINRAMPKTQSALLEAMAEQQVTVDGVTRTAPRAVPRARDAEPDRVRGHVPAPRGAARPLLRADDARLPGRRRRGADRGRAARLAPADASPAGRRARGGRTATGRVETVFVHEAVSRWIVDLVRATRLLDVVAIGSSVRGSLALNRASRAWAIIHGRRYVTPDDVERLFVPVLMHRLLFRPSFLAEIRDHGWEAASLEVRRRCVEAAPSPASTSTSTCPPPSPARSVVAVGVFPLVPRRRVIGLAFGGVRSVRRGTGSDVAGSREYQPGDDVAWIDWAASARISAARADDHFIVRELFADEAPRVVVLADRCASMGIRSSALRSLDKPGALLAILDLVGESARTARSLTGYLDYAYGEPYSRPPRTEHAAAPGTFERAVPRPRRHRLARARLPRAAPARPAHAGVRLRRLGLPRAAGRAGLAAGARAPLGARARPRAGSGLELSFPEVGGITVPYADPATGAVVPVHLTTGETNRLRAEHEARREALTRTFRGLGLEPVDVHSHGPADVLSAFLRWADLRLMARGAVA